MKDQIVNGWSKKWRMRLIFSSLLSFLLLTPPAILGYEQYGIIALIPIVVVYLLYTIPVNRFISKKNKEEVEKIANKSTN